MRIFHIASAFTLLAGSALSLSAATATVTVDGHSMPWLWDTTSLNTSFQFGTQDGLGPAVVDSSSGISFAAGGTLTITYISGLTSAFASTPEVDGNGYGPNPPSPFVYDASNNPGSSGTFFPSFYVDPATYPVYLNALIGTFADSAGNIVGTPFAVNNGPLMEVIPTGATQLQLGVNDDIFSDNTGSLLVQVTGPGGAAPEPSTALLIPVGALAAIVWRRRRQASPDAGR